MELHHIGSQVVDEIHLAEGGI